MNATFRAGVLIIFAVVCAMAWTIISLQPIPNEPKEIIINILGVLVIGSLTWAIIEIVIITKGSK